MLEEMRQVGRLAPLIQVRSDASLSWENGKRKRESDGYEMFRDEKLGDLLIDYTCGLHKKGEYSIIPRCPA